MASELETGVADEVRALLKEVPAYALLVRLAWHDAGTYSVSDGTGGANGSVRLEPEISHGANAGLKKGVDMLEPIKAKYPDISYADLYQLASVTAIEVAGGPKIPFKLGRKDADCTTDDGRLPDATQRMPHLREVFYRMGFNDKEIVALSGAHCLGGAHKDRSGFEGNWTEDPTVFNNAYFVNILKEDQNDGLLRLPTDLALLDEPECADLVKAYAADQELFFTDYAAAHQKLSELGMSA